MRCVGAGSASFPTAQWCGHSFGPACCGFDALSVQLWLADDGSQALSVANTDSNATLAFTAVVRGRAAAVTHVMPPRSAVVLVL